MLETTALSTLSQNKRLPCRHCGDFTTSDRDMMPPTQVSFPRTERFTHFLTYTRASTELFRWTGRGLVSKVGGVHPRVGNITWCNMELEGFEEKQEIPSHHHFSMGKVSSLHLTKSLTMAQRGRH